MGKKKKRLKQLTAGIVIGAITISTIIGTMFAANSIKPEEATTSVAVFEDLLNNRSFVIDTFTKRCDARFKSLWKAGRCWKY